jgi:hypothetical protein
VTLKINNQRDRLKILYLTNTSTAPARKMLGGSGGAAAAAVLGLLAACALTPAAAFQVSRASGVLCSAPEHAHKDTTKLNSHTGTRAAARCRRPPQLCAADRGDGPHRFCARASTARCTHTHTHTHSNTPHTHLLARHTHTIQVTGCACRRRPRPRRPGRPRRRCCGQTS